MAIKKILVWGTKEGNKALNSQCAPVSFQDKEALASLLSDLADTILSNDIAVGLSANQIGVNKRVFAVYTDKKMKFYINPRIVQKSKDHVDFKEGCLSRPGVERHRRRAKAILLTWYNIKGKKITKRITGFDAIVIQHEIDHLDGRDCLGLGG